MTKVIITDENSNVQTIFLPEKFNIEVEGYKTTDVISKDTFVRKIQDLISASNSLKEKIVFQK